MTSNTDENLGYFIAQLEADASLLDADQLRRRIEVVDELDARFGHTESGVFRSDASIQRRAKVIRERLDAVNFDLYTSIRAEIQRGASPERLLQWMLSSAGAYETGAPSPGLGYDYQDELVSGILRLREPSQTIPAGPEMVFYQPSPVRHILHLIQITALTEADVLFDLGSGLGHVPLLVSMLTGARTVGIEVEAAYVRSARECAQSLCLRRVAFVQQDARTADFSRGTVFYLYSPFTGTILTHVLDRLRRESVVRPIRICTLGPCTSVVAGESWLKASSSPDTEQITVFASQ